MAIAFAATVCALDVLYSHQLTFPTDAAQASYFTSLAVYGFDATDYTYIGKNKTLRVNKNADELYGCNYGLRYRNNIYGDTRLPGGFIDAIEWMSEVSFRIFHP